MTGGRVGEGKDLRRLLRAAADEHSPDRARMRARVARGMVEEANAAEAARGRRPRRGRARGWPRAAGAVLALGATLGGAAVVAGLAEGGGRAAVSEVALPSSGALDPGSGERWSQSNVTVETAEPLTAFTVELRVALGEGVRPTGAWRSLPGDDFDVTVGVEEGALVFRWELRPGAEVPPGEHVFAGRYDHEAGPRDTAGDRYAVAGEGPGVEVTAEGRFPGSR
ncbi:hypothetical protein [Streptomyces sp. PT12]|uniref:hypothetical protein n=1 Tax=Streptomyces sp. PT12 TaxID=1510197 RepID=UPI000E06A478|nr:hypothetical protein [Streptomyces sp. PT12]RBM17042.1 hypothetical protein DEH69_15725 [Streptomyces sp. PT12]